MHNIKPGKKKIITKTSLFYVTFVFVHFSSKQLIFVYNHTLGTERLVTGDCSVRAWHTNQSTFFLLSTKQIGQKKRV